MRARINHNTGIRRARCVAATEVHHRTDSRVNEFVDTAWVVVQSLLSVATAIAALPLLAYLF